MSNDTNEMHDQTGAPLGHPPSQVVALDPVSFESDWKIFKKFEEETRKTEIKGIAWVNGSSEY